MSVLLDNATARLATAKRIYQNALYGIDNTLQAAVAANPAELSAARALQNSYGVVSVARVLPYTQDVGTALELLQVADGPVTVVRV